MTRHVVVVGHKNPDNDSISAAVSLAYLKNEIEKRAAVAEGRDVEVEYEACCLGPLPPESAWVLEQGNLPAPRLIDHVDPDQEVILVDHNESQQAVDGMREAHVIQVIDHHRIGDFESAGPIELLFHTWGSTATIVSTLYQDNDIEIPEAYARVMLSAILTDTVILKSPTATAVDERQVKFLSELIGVTPREFGLEIFRTRGGEAGIPIEKFVLADSKEFKVAGNTVLIAQHETVDLAAAMERESEARDFIKGVITDKGYDFVLLLVTDILEEGSNFVVEGNHAIVDQVFGIDSSTAVWMPGVLSRKKQVAAPLMNA